MKFVFLATALTFATTTMAIADQLISVGGGTAKGGGRFLSYVDKDSVLRGKNNMVRFIIVNQFEKPQQIPQNKKSFSTALQDMIANCSNKTVMNPTVAFLTNQKVLVARMATGEKELAEPPAIAKIMLAPAVDLACKTAQSFNNTGKDKP